MERATLSTGNGKVLDVVARNQSAGNVYVQKVRLNGEPVCHPVLRHSQLQGATLEFEMGAAPAPGGGYHCESK